MPNASLLLVTSPLLLGPVPSAEVAEMSLASPPAIVAEAPVGAPHNLLPLEWSLADIQDQPPEQGAESAEERDPNEIVVEGEYGPPEGDPMAAVNEASYRIVQDIDEVLIGPIAYGYRDGLPRPIRDGLGNVVRNLREPVNFLNFLLQFKIGDAFETLGRFAINSTIGVGGLFDVAGGDAIGLPYRRNGFANTLGYYGVDTGAYLYLPIAGATTVRDLIGDTLDQAVVPFAVGKPFNTPEYAVPYFIVSNLDARLEFDTELERIGETVDPYAARRDSYLYYREREIALLKGEEPPEPPAIVREIEEGVDAVNEEYEEEEEEAAEDDGVEEEANATDAPQISYQNTLEMPEAPVRVAITQLRGR